MGVIDNMRSLWFDIQASWNPWISLGFHINHHRPSFVLHLPGVIIAAGWLLQPGFPYSLRRSLGNDDIPGWKEAQKRINEYQERRERFEECDKNRHSTEASEPNNADWQDE